MPVNSKTPLRYLVNTAFFVLVLCGANLWAQKPPATFQPIRIDRVMIFGNDHTRREVILREIPFTFPDTLDMPDFQVIQNRLLNLNLFKRIDLNIFKQGNQNILIIQVYELWYLYPLPVFKVNDRDWNKLSYGMEFSHLNFRGRNEKLSVGALGGYNPTFFVNYFNPWLGQKSKLTFSFSVFVGRRYNRFYRFDEHQIGTKISLGKRLSLNSTLSANVEFRRVSFPDSERYLSESRTGLDLVPRLGFSFVSDNRDLKEYPLSGHLIDWRVTRTGFTSRQAQYWRSRTDLRVYKKVAARLSFGARNLTILNFGSVPAYDLIYIGFGERIRGYFDHVFTAQNLMIQSAEIRIPVIKSHYFSLPKAPLVNAFTQNLKYALNIAIFADTGIVWNRAEQFKRSRFRSGYGIGLNMFLPFRSLMRIEYALNDRGGGEWIIDSGISF